MRRAGLLVLLIVAGVLAGEPPPARPAPPIPTKDFASEPAYEVIDVRAGSVVVVQLAGEQRALRLIGLYVPNAGTENDAARAYLWNLLRGERVYVDYEADWPLRDRDERYWAYVYRAPDGLFVNLELIRLGYGRLSAPDPFEFKELFRAYEDFAHRAKKGVWAEPAASQPTSQPATTQPAPTRATPTQPAPPASDDVVVYVTRSGDKYHRAECQYAKGATPTALKDAKARGLMPCSRCRPPE